MKCTCCGNTNLKKLDDNGPFPFWVDNGWDGAGRLRFNNCEAYICTSCGHYEFFNTEYVAKIKAEKQFNDGTMELISNLEGKRDALINREFNPEPYEKEIERLEKEINTLKSLSVSGRDLKIREEALAENKRILESKIDPKTQNEINRLNGEIDNLRRQLK